MKQILDLRPAYHRLEERIRAHVLLCWLALLLIRIAETSTGQTWPAIRRELDRIHLGTFTGPAGTFRQRTELTKPVRDLLAKLTITPHRQIIELTDYLGHLTLRTGPGRGSRETPCRRPRQHARRSRRQSVLHARRITRNPGRMAPSF